MNDAAQPLVIREICPAVKRLARVCAAIQKEKRDGENVAQLR